MRGLYIHFPFCASKCAYCDFYSLPGRQGDIHAYVRSLLAQAKNFPGLDFQTLYIGGGTPSLFPPAELRDLLGGLKHTFDLSGLSEATLEANPDSLNAGLLEAATASGFNRLSIGVQSLADCELQSVGRIHSADRAVQSIELAFKNGFTNLSADVILGLPGQDWLSLMITLETLVALPVVHLSLYCLSVEPHTPLAASPSPDLPGEDAQADLYDQAVSLLAKRGFAQYEISNFSLPGYECQHNLNYWRGGEYLGLGPAAASHLDGKRFRIRPDLDSYLKDPTVQIGEIEELPPEKKAAEEAITRLRLLQEGLDVAGLGQKFGDENILGLVGRLNALVKEGSLVRNGSNYRLVAAYALVSNSILLKLLDD